jgi:hypothetical protein
MSRILNKKFYTSSCGFMYNCNIAMQRQTTNTMYPQLHTRACLPFLWNKMLSSTGRRSQRLTSSQCRSTLCR